MNNAEDLLRNRHLKAREYFTEINHQETGKLIYPGAPFKMSETPWQIRYPAPLLGQHNEEIYCEFLGYTLKDLIKLREEGVI